ncbi:probable disease resistance protein At1g62630 [Vitis riparia]|uniref:probable disease resistance protein At1g62630 n=1 Tax=Vitis riparia TaxID=96939 RepID=UPI00155B2203|nr:probable disease resistance protein At1g62630 [Vitis riparia]
MADIVISVVAKVAEYLVAPIGRQLGYLYNYRCNLDKLEEQVEKLGVARGRLQRDVDEADRQGDEIEPDVQKWLTRTEGIIQKAKELIEDERAANTSCFNLKLRYQRSRQSKKQSGDIGKIQEENKFDRVSYCLPPQRIWSPRLRDCEALESRASILNEIMEALRNDDIRMIGVWGMGGVGKTTLPNQVAKKAEEDKLVENVVMALNISRVPNVTKIQGEIASMLGLKFEEEEGSGRAARLSKKEAWSLFKKTAGDSVEQLKSIAIKVLIECDGLPVAIVTVAKALKGQSEVVWNNALQELENSTAINIEDVHEKVYSCLELSYNHLKGDEVKRLFLLCGMLGYGDISMDQLLKYGMGLDLFEHVSSLEQIRNILVTLIKILKGSSLLLDAEDSYYYKWPDENMVVRMHDVVGDVARAIAAKDPHRFVVIKEALGLEEWQRNEEFRNCSRISLQCRDLRELPERLSFMPGCVYYNRSARTLKLWRVNKPCLVDCFSKLFKTVEDLELNELEDTKQFFYELDTQGFLQLKYLSIIDCPGRQYIVDSTKGVPSHSALPILEELVIDGLENMDAVCYGLIPEGSFGKLRSLTVDDCKRLKSFISLPMERGRDGWVLPEMGSLDSTRDFSSTGSSATQELSRSDVPTPFFNEQVC